MRLIPFLAFAILSVILTAMLLQRSEPRPVGDASAKPLPALHVVALEGGKPWNTAALKGHVTVLNFFASWCAPCAAEMPEIKALRKKFPQLRIEGVAWNDEPNALRDWLKKNGNPFHAIWLDKKGDATIALGLRGIPETLVVDAQGAVRFRIAGPLTPQMREGEFPALLKTLLDEAPHAQ